MRILTERRSKDGDRELEVLNGVRVMSCISIVLGNTFWYVLKSPLQNLEVAQEWMQHHHLFFVLSADNGVDTFFWLTAFLFSYKMLSSAH